MGLLGQAGVTWCSLSGGDCRVGPLTVPETGHLTSRRAGSYNARNCANRRPSLVVNPEGKASGTAVVSRVGGWGGTMAGQAQTDSIDQASQADSWKMFDRIAPRYDLLNRLLSFRRDVVWRRFLYQKLPPGQRLRVLDLATGTADVLLGLHLQGDKIAFGVGIDRSANMLALGQAKLEKAGAAGPLATHHGQWAVVRGDAGAIAVKEETFDAATMAFGIRNVPDVPQTLRDIRRVLKPEGRVLILEFSLPANGTIRALYLLYFRHILTRVGAWVSGDRRAYRYLNQTVERFPYGEAFCDLMRSAGFRDVQAFPLTFGIATLYQGDK